MRSSSPSFLLFALLAALALVATANVKIEYFEGSSGCNETQPTTMVVADGACLLDGPFFFPIISPYTVTCDGGADVVRFNEYSVGFGNPGCGKSAAVARWASFPSGKCQPKWYHAPYTVRWTCTNETAVPVVATPPPPVSPISWPVFLRNRFAPYPDSLVYIVYAEDQREECWEDYRLTFGANQTCDSANPRIILPTFSNVGLSTFENRALTITSSSEITGSSFGGIPALAGKLRIILTNPNTIVKTTSLTKDAFLKTASSYEVSQGKGGYCLHRGFPEERVFGVQGMTSNLECIYYLDFQEELYSEIRFVYANP